MYDHIRNLFDNPRLYFLPCKASREKKTPFFVDMGDSHESHHVNRPMQFFRPADPSPDVLQDKTFFVLRGTMWSKSAHNEKPS